MSYKDSFIYSLRQKVGDMRLITATINVVPIDEGGRLKMVYSKQVGYWTTVGGHVELGDSWQSAAANELYEEAGIQADRSDMELAATISGPKRIYQYPDGTTQPFTLIFICRKWNSESSPTDEEEIGKTAWFSFDEAVEKSADPRTKSMLDACREYIKTGKVQHIVEE